MERNTSKHARAMGKITYLRDYAARNQATDAAADGIASAGYVRTGRLWRRWILIQVFRVRTPCDWRASFDRAYFRNKPYSYEWETMANELGAMARMSGAELADRERFFGFRVVRAMLLHYRLSVAELCTAGSRGRAADGNEFVRVPGTSRRIYLSNGRPSLRDIVSSIDAAQKGIDRAQRHRSYRELKSVVDAFRNSVPLPGSFRKSDAWMAAFKSAGAYYAMDNLVKFHGCRFPSPDGAPMGLMESVRHLERIAGELLERPDGPDAEGMFDAMVSLVDYNGFEFTTHGDYADE